MANLNITLDLEELTEAVLSSDMTMMMKSLAVTVFNAYMEVERDRYIKAKNYERNDERIDQRNGYYERDYTLSVGTVKLKVPRTRSGEFKTEVFDKYQRMDKAFILSMAEMVTMGVSTRKVTNVIEKLCGENVSKSFVSDIMKEIDPEIDAFKTRTLDHSYFKYIYVDAMYVKVREDHRVVSKALYVAQGVNNDNQREVLGFMVAGQESEANWAYFFEDLIARGLKQPHMIISDAHAGLKAAIEKVFVGATWQRCTFHFVRNITNNMPKKGSAIYRQAISNILRSTTPTQARRLKKELETELADNKKYEAALKTLDEGFEDAIQYMMEPQINHVHLRTTNSLERVNRELRRRDKVIGIYPNLASVERQLGSILLDLHENWEKSSYKFLKG